MKNKIANFFKLGTLLLGISFLLYNCEDEKIEPIKQENLEGRFKFTLTQKKAVNVEVFSKLKIPITKTLSKNTSERNVNVNLTVLTDYYSKIESNTYSTYAFEIAGATINQYQNLTVIKKEDTPLEYYLVSYIKDENSTNEFPYNVTYQVLDANLNLIDTSLLEKTTDFSINEETVNSSQKCYRLRFLPCGCRGKADGHSPTPGYSCCEGSPAMLVQTSCLDSGLCGGLPCPVPVGDPCNDCSDNPNGPGGTTPSNGGNSSGGGAGSPAPTSNHYGSNICFSDGTCTAGLYIPSISTRRIEDILKLNVIESNWLNSIKNIGIKQLIVKQLNENNNSTEVKNFIKEAIKTYMFGTAKEIAATNMTLIISSNNNLLNISYDASFFNQINQYATADLSDPYIQSIWIAHFSAQCAIIKLQNPDWSDYKIYWEASKEIIHIGLDIGGMVPVVGEVCDVTNGVIYTIQGDGVNASLSFAAAIPIAGWAATGSKYAYKLTQYTINGTKVKLVLKILNDGSVYFGSSGRKLRIALGLTDASKHAHHLIPWALKNHNLVQKAAKSKSAFHINEVLNGIPRLSNLHLTGHTAYNNKIKQILNSLDSNGPIDVDQAYNFVSGLANHIRTVIKNNPNLNSGQIANLITFPN
ncbi:hypothetical protein PG911_12780 [Tenacibaculum ovolyticum]|uniref:AHH domain-containing protein n=1 Tax=Tenacibaculum ovolyticum TaxID=104270 RepID=UPI0022F3CC5A|nr:hypothetical protein [Tenacibaculum ovolyticum]WBX75525.1 hypothetical protein PG911_12780 [Tenacibaculum ovolyticum]